jgi:predicted outer membrane lipoprotein
MGLLCLTCLSLVGTMRWLRGRAVLSWEVPAAILGFALAAAFGPISAVRLSLRSQASMAARILDEAGAGRTVAAASGLRRVEVAPARYDELGDALRLLAELGGEPAVRQVLTGATSACASRWQVTECLGRLGVYPAGSAVATAASAATVATFQAHGRFSTAAGAVELIELVREPDDPDRPPVRATPAEGPDVWLASDRVVIHAGGTMVAQASLAALIALPDINYGLPTWTRPLVGPDGKTVAELAVERLELRQVDGRPPQAVRLTGVVIWRR